MSSPAERLAAGLADRYRLERQLGEGGMATVWLAEDLRHGRKVAIKLLHPELSALLGGERFLKEIELTASLQHPHILPLFDSGSADGLLYYVMPFVAGETLRARLDRERQLPVADAVRITQQVAQALDYAHRRGVVHRDIKPENILLHEDSALVADFGIALAVQHAGGQRMTQTGLSLGTPQYMSPEQAMGERTLDARTDIYALGAVAYEMLAGEPPFTGATAQAIVAKVITEKPAPLASHRDTVPPHVAAAIHLALSKLAADRWASAREFATALEERGWAAMPVPGRTTVALPAAKPPRFGPVAVALLLSIASVALGAALGWMLHRPPAEDETRLDVLRGDEGADGIAFAPDGRTLAVASPTAGGGTIALRRLDRLALQPVQGTEDAVLPAFSPDGRQLAFIRLETPRSGSLWRVGLDGAPPVKLAEGAAGRGLGPPSWGEDGWIYFIQQEGVLARVRETGGPVEQLAVPDPERPAAYGYVEALPGGRVLVSLLRLTGTFVDNEIAIWDIAKRKLGLLGKGVLARRLPHGQLLYLDAAGVLQRDGFDAAGGRLAGGPVAIADQVQMNVQGTLVVAASPGGDIAYRVSPGFNLARRRLLLVNRAGARRPTALPVGPYSSVRVSPDGRRLAFDLTSPTADGGDVALATVGDSLVRTLARGVGDYPVWTPDGKRIAWTRLADGERDLVWQAADGSDSAQVLLRRPGEQWQVEFVPGTDRMLVREGNAVGGVRNLDIVSVRVGGDSAAPFAGQPNVLERAPRVSPDGRWAAYVSNETGRDEVYVRPVAGGPAVQVSDGGAIEPVFGRGGRDLFFKSAGFMTAATWRAEAGRFEVLARRRLFSLGGLFNNPWQARYDVLPGDSTFIMVDGGEDLAAANARTIVIRHPAFLDGGR